MPYYYPWVVFYRKSLWEQRGYQPAKTLDEFVALSKQMQKDGLAPLSGCVTTWRELLPYHQEGANGRTWQEAAQALDQKKAGMYLLGMFVGQSLPDATKADDIDFFPFPEINPDHGQDAVEAPIDGFMVSAKVKNEEGARELLKYLASAEAQETYLNSDPNNVATHNEADTSKYSALQQKAVELVSGAKHISQFLDRDTRPDFASTVMILALQEFINQPNEIDSLLKSIESQKKNIFSS